MSQQPKGKGQGGGKKPQNQPQASKNISDADFGPPLGARGKPKSKKKETQDAKPKVVSQPQAGHSPGPPSQASAWGKPAQSGPSVSQPPQAGGAWGKPAKVTPKPTAAPAAQSSTAWGKPAEKPVQAAPTKPPTNQDKKRQLDDSSAGSTQKFHADEETRGEAQRGNIHGRGSDEGKIIITKPGHITSKRGTTGQPLKVRSNYFDVSSKGRWQIYHHHVVFSPTIENAAFKNALLVQQKETLGAFVYDRGSSVYLIRQLDADIEFQTRDRENIEYLIKMTRVSLISSSEKEYLQVLNVIMKKALNALQLQLVGRDYFDPQATIRIPDFKLQLWPGYSTSIRQHESNLMLNAEIKFKLMRDESLLDIMIRCHNDNRNNWQDAFTRQILGSIVLTRYNNKTYKITDVNYSLTPMSTFERREGPISYFEYYRQVRNINIVDKKQPLLVSIPTEKNRRSDPNQIINLVPELCYATGYTDQMRKDFRLMQATAAHTRVGPAGRIERLLAFNKRLQHTPESIQCFNDWLLALNTNLVDVPARQLPAEIIVLGENRSQPADHNASWVNALQGRNSMNVSTKLERWAVVIPRAVKRQTEDFIKMMLDVSKGMRFTVSEPTRIDINDDRTITLGNELQNLCQQNLQMIMVAVGSNSADRYSTIKKTCCVRNATPTQVVTSRVMDPRNMSKMRSVATKVSIQINAKIGGLPWTVDVKMDNIMFIGYDVCHDTHNRANSYGAVVATMDMRKSTRFFSAVSAHTKGEEMSNNLAMNVVKALKQYVKIHKVLPARIMLYRDGVGDGQLNYVYEHELQTLLGGLKTVYGDNPIKFAFVVVSKRINTKFFIGDQTNARNVPAGTVVDDVVTLPERYDFFVVSQAVTQGTATPTSYNVIYDTFGLPPDKIQMMTYKMCHLYFNWSGTVRVPAPCQYAHKLAFLVGNYLHQSPSAGLEQLLYFL